MHNAALCAFLVFTGRLLVHGATPGDALALMAMAALHGYTLYLRSRETKPVTVAEDLQKDVQDLKNSLGALKMGAAFRK